MKIHDLLEYGSANPFVSLISSVDLRLRQLKSCGSQQPSKMFIDSLTRQLSDFDDLVTSAANWVIPEQDLREKFQSALPALKKATASAVASVRHGDFEAAVEVLLAARSSIVKHSGLTFYDFDKVK